MDEKLDLEMIAMTLIGRAGESKSLAYQALAAAKEGKFEEAEEFMKKGSDEMLQYINTILSVINLILLLYILYRKK